MSEKEQFILNSKIIKDFILKNDSYLIINDDLTLFKIRIKDHYMIFANNISYNSLIHFACIVDLNGDFKLVNDIYHFPYHTLDLSPKEIEDINSNFVSFLKIIHRTMIDEILAVKNEVVITDEDINTIGKTLFDENICLEHPLRHIYFNTYNKIDNLSTIQYNNSLDSRYLSLNFSIPLLEVFFNNNWEKDIVNLKDFKEITQNMSKEYKEFCKKFNCLKKYREKLLQDIGNEELTNFYNICFSDSSLKDVTIRFPDGETMVACSKDFGSTQNKNDIIRNQCLYNSIPISAIFKIKNSKEVLFEKSDENIDFKEMAYDYINTPNPFKFLNIDKVNYDDDFLLFISKKVINGDYGINQLGSYTQIIWENKNVIKNLLETMPDNSIHGVALSTICYNKDIMKNMDIVDLILKNSNKFKDFNDHIGYFLYKLNFSKVTKEIVYDIAQYHCNWLTNYIDKIDDKIINSKDFIDKIDFNKKYNNLLYRKLIEKIDEKNILLAIPKKELAYNLLYFKPKFLSDINLVKEIEFNNKIDLNEDNMYLNLAISCANTNDTQLLLLFAKHITSCDEAYRFINELELNDDFDLIQEFASFNPYFVRMLSEYDQKVFFEAMIDSIKNITKIENNCFAMEVDFGTLITDFQSQNYILNKNNIYEYKFDLINILPTYKEDIINKINEIYNLSIPSAINFTELPNYIENELEKNNKYNEL